MTRAERYLEKGAEFQKRDWEQHPPPRRISSFSATVANVALWESPSIFEGKLIGIFREWNESRSQLQKGSHFDIDFSDIDSGRRDWSVSDKNASLSRPFVASIVGGSEQLKTTTLNNLLNLFGFNCEGHRKVFDKNLLPTHSGNGAGLPLPVKLQYGERFELVLERWTKEQLDYLMRMVARKTVAKEWGRHRRYHNLQHESLSTFGQFVSKHWKMEFENESLLHAAQILKADGGIEVQSFEDCQNPSVNAHQALFTSVLSLITDGTWLAYKRVTLRCPAELLRLMGPSVEIVDLPGIGVCDGNMEIVEELVVREVSRSDAVMFFSQPQKETSPDIYRVLGRCLFPRLLNPTVVPPPSVALINSGCFASMRMRSTILPDSAYSNDGQPDGMKSNHKKAVDEKADWEQWVTGTINRWNENIETFAATNFSDRRWIRSPSEVEPSVFAHDLGGFLDMGPKDHAELTRASVAALFGYFFHLPQQRSVSLVRQVLARTNAYLNTLDDLWRATMPSNPGFVSLGEFKSRRSKRLVKLKFFEKVLGYKLAGSKQKEMFGWEDARSFKRQMCDLETNVQRELGKIRPKFMSAKGDLEHLQLRQQAPQLLKQLLLDLASSWDNTVGRAAFESFVGGAGELSLQMFKRWVPKLFHENPWCSRADRDRPVRRAKAMLLKLLKAKVPEIISSSAIQYTLTDSYCQLVRNLDTRMLLGLDGRKSTPGRPTSTEQLWKTFKSLVLQKSQALQDLVEKNILHPLQSQHVKELVERLKHLMTEALRDSVNDFMKLSIALQGISLGAKEDTWQRLLGDCYTMPCISSVVDLQKALQTLEKQIKMYLDKTRDDRAEFGMQKLNEVLITPGLKKDPEPVFRKRKKSLPVQDFHSFEGNDVKKCKLSPAMSSTKKCQMRDQHFGFMGPVI